MRTVLLMTLLALSTICTPFVSAETGARMVVDDNRIRLLAGVSPEGSIGGPAELGESKVELTERQRARILNGIRDNIDKLRAEGRLRPTEPGRSVLLEWPLRPAPGLHDPGYHTLVSLVDHDPAYPGELLDYECGDRTYDLASGYNHRGTDLLSWPFWWRKMDNDELQVVAAAAGQIVFREDGHYDRNCDAPDVMWNVVVVQHADGSLTIYGHLKNGSLTPLQPGDPVEKGSYLGIVGSSGRSSLPHLHFEVHDHEDSLIDPFAGPCNSLNVESWWADQSPYNDSAVNLITTGDAVPDVIPTCPTPEEPNTRVTFDVGPTIHFTSYHRHQLSSQTIHYTIYRPDSSVYSQFDFNCMDPFMVGSYWSWTYPIPPEEPTGTWLFEVVFEGRTYLRPFAIGTPAPAGSVPQYRVHGTQLEIAKLGEGLLNLFWGASCVSSDTDFVVYEGSLTDFTSHVPIHCSTGGHTRIAITPNSEGRYYLIVPRNADHEGSAGKGSDDVGRSAGLSSCVPREIIDCP